MRQETQPTWFAQHNLVGGEMPPFFQRSGAPDSAYFLKDFKSPYSDIPYSKVIYVNRVNCANHEPFWLYARGSYNVVYRSFDGSLICKMPIGVAKKRADDDDNDDDDDECQFFESETDNPERAVRLWNEINAAFIAHDEKLRATLAKVVHASGKITQAWLAPFIEGKKPTVDALSDAVCRIYQEHGRILVDAISAGNFIAYRDTIICVDVSFALKLESRIEEEKSEASLDFWKNTRDEYQKYFEKYRAGAFRPVIQRIKALLVLQNYFPAIRDVSFLKNHALLPSLLDALEDVYDDKITFPQEIFHRNPEIRLKLMRVYTELHVIEVLIYFSSPDARQQLCVLINASKDVRVSDEMYLNLRKLKKDLEIFAIIEKDKLDLVSRSRSLCNPQNHAALLLQQEIEYVQTLIVCVDACIAGNGLSVDIPPQHVAHVKIATFVETLTKMHNTFSRREASPVVASAPAPAPAPAPVPESSSGYSPLISGALLFLAPVSRRVDIQSPLPPIQQRSTAAPRPLH